MSRLNRLINNATYKRSYVHLYKYFCKRKLSIKLLSNLNIFKTIIALKKYLKDLKQKLNYKIRNIYIKVDVIVIIHFFMRNVNGQFMFIIKITLALLSNSTFFLTA